MKIPISRMALHGNERRYVAEAMESGWISSAGPFVERFEAEFAKYIGVKHAISTCNGTAALHLMLAALGIGESQYVNEHEEIVQDEVILPTLTFPATANMVRLCGAKVVLCDVDPQTWCIDPAKASLVCNERTAAILGVSLYGHPTEYTRPGWPETKIKVLEDAAQAVGALVCDDDLAVPNRKPDRKVGSLAHASTFSFYGNKTLTCGEGGMVTTDDDALAAKMRRLRAHGEDPARKFWFPEMGYNYRMSNIHAAIGLAQLERIEEKIAARQRVAAGYVERLKPLITDGRLSIQHFGGLNCRHAWWMFSIVLTCPGHCNSGLVWNQEKGDGTKICPYCNGLSSRNPMRRRLEADGIETRPILYPLHLMPVYSESPNEMGDMGRFPVAERIALNGMNLPTYEDLTEGEQDYICERIKHHLG